MTTTRTYELANEASSIRGDVVISPLIRRYHFWDPSASEGLPITPREHSWDRWGLTINLPVEFLRSWEGVITTPYLVGKEYGAGESMIVHSYRSNSPLLHTQNVQWSNFTVLPRALPISGEPDTIDVVGSWHPVAAEFALGSDGVTPEQSVVNMVDRISRALIEKAEDAEYSVDDDGALSFETTLPGGLFIMCEVSLAGNINAGLYRDGTAVDLVKFLPYMTERGLLDLF